MPRKKKAVEPVAAATAAATPAPSAAEHSAAAPLSEAPTPEPPAKTWAGRGPTWETTVTLAERPDGPKMRFGRNNTYRQVAVRFDEAPCGEVLDRLHDAGWKRRPAEGVWTLQLEHGREARGHQEAATFFAGLAALERRARGLGPTPARGR